jgi:transcriptional regulator with XRE-family HTH domain
MPERTGSTPLDVLLVTGPFDAALRAAVRGRGLTLDRLRAHLARRGVGIALSTLSDWQHGKRRPAVTGSLHTVQALEEVLGLRPGTLVRLLVDPAAEAPAQRTYRRRGVDERSGDLAGLLDRIPNARAVSSDKVSDHQLYTIGADRRLATLWSRKVIRARYDGADRYVLRYFGDPGCDADRVEIRPVRNCRLGQVVRSRSGIVVAELEFGEKLAAGDTWVFEIEIADPTGKPTTECAHAFRGPHQQYLMEVRFDPAALPVDCHSFAQTDLYERRQRTGDLVLNRHHELHLLTGGLAGGVVGIGWRWP